MDIMKPIPTTDIPSIEEGFVYEVKYDGFRAILNWTKDDIKLVSKNNKDLTNLFPEIVTFCKDKQSRFNDLLPLTLDGELVILNNNYQANFSLLQTRGRLKKQVNIQKEAKTRPATFMAFDIIQCKGSNQANISYIERKKTLKKVLSIPENVISYVPYFTHSKQIWDLTFLYKGEGIIAKRKNSQYSHGKKHRDWFKIKNWRTILGFLTSYDSNNGYFTVGVYFNDEIYHIGKCKHGLEEEANHTLKKLFMQKGKKKHGLYTLPPAICAHINTLDLHGGELREPQFSHLLPHILPKNCTMEQLKIDLAMFPPHVEISKTDKIFWNKAKLTKGDLLIYIRELSPYMLPYLRNRALTVIRCPDGVAGESFFQKSLPTYAPSFVQSVQKKDKNLIICNHLDALIWLTNHGAVEFHIPFQTLSSEYPTEIVFDLDPPNKKEFKVTILAANLIKQILDHLEIHSFIKTSGNKGLQIHIPIPAKSMSYEDTALFTEAIATTLVNEYPEKFTIERLKKNRNNRLYIDYIQHGKDKTLIAPYSPRKTKEATVATPLYWDEVNDDLSPDSFTIMNVIDRVQTIGCPFANYSKIGDEQKLDKLWQLIK